MTSKDTRKHYPKEPITFSMLPGVWKTSNTMCGKRREIGMVTDIPSLIICDECIAKALEYWLAQRDSCESLIDYAESGQLKGTSAEKESEDLMPKLRMALEDARINVEILILKG